MTNPKNSDTGPKHASNADTMTAWCTPAGQLPLDVAAAAVRLHTLYRSGHAPVATVERHRKGAKPYLLTTIHGGVAESSSWHATESDAIAYARALGYES